MMKISKTNLDGVLIIKPAIFKDFRGQFIEIYNLKKYKKRKIKIRFVEDDISVSKKNVLRGIHGYYTKTWRLVTCVYGKVYLVIIDCNEKSKNFGKWQSFILSDIDKKQILVPPGYGIAHLILSKVAIFYYKQSTFYNPKAQFTYKWNDSRFKIKWPIKHIILSQRDKEGHYIKI